MAKLPNTPDLKRLRELPPSLISLPRGTALHRIYRRAGGYPTLWNDLRYYGPIARFDHQRRDDEGLACISHHPTVEAHDTTAMTSLRLLAVLNVPSSTPARAKRRAPRPDGPLTHFASPRGEKCRLAHEQARGILYFALDIPTALAEVFQERRTVNRTDLQPWLVSIKLANDLSLLNLTDTFCAQAGGSMKLVSGPFVYAQNWSRSLYERYEGIHGLYYPSSLTNRPAVALYERALDAGPFPDAPLFHRQLSDPLLIEPLRNACREIGYDFL